MSEETTNAGGEEPRGKNKKGPAECEALEAKAFEIFRDLVTTQSRGITEDELARRAFRSASAFQKIAAGVRSGKIDTEPVEPLKPKKVKVKRMRAKYDGPGFDVVLDEHKNPIMDEVIADPFAYAPNLPADHPANARFQPIDGPTLQERIDQYKRDVALAN